MLFQLSRILAAIGLFMVPRVVLAATILPPNGFESGGTGGWSGGASPTNQATGGPTGDGDHFLMLTSNGGNGPGSIIATYNNEPEWTGDFVSDDIKGLSVDLMNPSSSNPLDLRLVLFGPDSTGNRWTSTDATTVPNDGVWRRYTFPISEADFTRVQGTSMYDDVTSDAVRFMLRHDVGGPSARGSAIEAQLGIDNIVLVPEPVFGPSLCSVLALATVGMARRLRRRER